MLDILYGVFQNSLGFFSFMASIPSILNSVIVGLPLPLTTILTSIFGLLLVYRFFSILL